MRLLPLVSARQGRRALPGFKVARKAQKTPPRQEPERGR